MNTVNLIKDNSNAKTQLEEDIERRADEFVAEDLKNAPPSNLLPPNQLIEKAKIELLDSLKFPDLNQLLEEAIKILYSDNFPYLSSETYQKLLDDLALASDRISSISLTELENETLQDLTNISNESMKAISDIGMAKFDEGSFRDSLALFTLLSFLNPGNFESWFRQGIAAYRTDNYELALRSFLGALELESENLVATMLAADCHLRCDRIEEAKALLNKAKEIASKNPSEDEVNELMNTIHQLIAER